MTDSQPWWPADFGHYGPLFIRMAWHSAGTYRIHGRPRRRGIRHVRFAPLGSWPGQREPRQGAPAALADQEEYGRKLSWADLMVLTGNVRARVDGLQDVRLCRRPRGCLEPEAVNWGSEATWLGDEAIPRASAAGEPVRRVKWA